MADNKSPHTDGDDATEQIEKKVPTGKARDTARRKTTTSTSASDQTAGPASDGVSMTKTDEAAPTWLPGKADAPRGKQITIGVSQIVKVLVGLLVAAVLVAAIFFGLQWKSDKAELDAAADAKKASDYFVTQLLDSMNTTTAGEYVNRMSPLTTGAFHDNLLNEREKTQTDIASMQLQITPEIWSSGVVSNTTDSATTLVVAEITGTSSVATTPVTNLGMFRLTLEKHDDKWLVSQMDPGPSSTGAGSAEPGAGVDPNAGVPAPATEPAPAPAPAG